MPQQAFMQVHVVDPILQVSARVIMDHPETAEVFADYFYAQGYDIGLSIVNNIPKRDEVELAAANEMLQIFSEFLQTRTLH